MQATLVTLMLVSLALACSSSNFAGDSGARKAAPPQKSGVDADEGADAGSGGKRGGRGGRDAGDGESDADDEGGMDSDQDEGLGRAAGNDDDAGGALGDTEQGAESFDIYSDEETKHLPKPCDGTNQKVVGVGAKCPAHFALYTMDDMSSKSRVPSSYVCCPLPSRDILSNHPDKQHQVRSRRCQSNEVMTGAVDENGNVYCSAINTERYKLQDAKLVCAGKKGGGGFLGFGGGGLDCGGSSEQVDRDALPGNVRALVIGPLGEDGCVTVPYGSLVIQQGGRRCDDSDAATLFYKTNGNPVKIFP